MHIQSCEVLHDRNALRDALFAIFLHIFIFLLLLPSNIQLNEYTHFAQGAFILFPYRRRERKKKLVCMNKVHMNNFINICFMFFTNAFLSLVRLLKESRSLTHSRFTHAFLSCYFYTKLIHESNSFKHSREFKVSRWKNTLKNLRNFSSQVNFTFSIKTYEQ